jgi:hypothetical protein
MATSFVTDCSKSTESTLTTADMLLLPPLPPTEITSSPPSGQESEKDQDHRRKKAYKWYKQYAKPTKTSMCSIVDQYANDADITRQDVDLLPWNPEETEVIREAMKSPRRRQRKIKRRLPTQTSSNKNMATSFVTDCSKSTESTLTTADMLLLPPLPPTEIISPPPSGKESEKDLNRRRKKAYKWYKHYAKPNKASMYSIVDQYSNDTGITRQDVDLLPWNPEETEVIREAMKSPKEKQKMENKEKKGRGDNNKDKKVPWNPEETEVIKEAMKSPKKKQKIEKKEKKGRGDKKKDKKEKERDGKEDTSFAKSNGYNKDTILLKGQIGDSSTSLDISRNGSSGSLDTSSSIWNQDHTQDHRVSAETEKKDKKKEKKEKERTQDHRKSANQLLTIKVEEEHKRRREERRRKREVAKKSVPKVDMQDKISADGNIKDVRRELAFLWYTRMGNPTRSEFKRKVAVVEVPITPEDIDLLPWNLTGRVVNMEQMNAIIRASILKQ